MSVNGSAAKLTTLSKSAVKALGASPMVWYAVEVNGDFFFGIDKRIKDPNKFKRPLKVKSYLEKLKVGDVSSIQKDSGVVAGLVRKTSEKVEISVVCKTNGAGKSTLKSLMRDSTVRKLLKGAEIVKQIGSGTDDSAEQALDARTEQTLESAGIQLTKELKDAVKYFLWWNDTARDIYRRGVASPSESIEDDLQKVYRRLKKFAEQKMYKLFETNEGIFFDTDGPLKRFKPTDFDLTKGHLKEYLPNLKSALGKIADRANTEEAAEEASADAQAELDSIANDFETITELMGISGSEARDFIAQASANGPVWTILWKDFGTEPEGLVALKNRLANGTWSDFFRIAKQFEGV